MSESDKHKYIARLEKKGKLKQVDRDDEIIDDAMDVDLQGDAMGDSTL